MKILIIEDEFNLADAIKAMLSKKKYDVTIKTDGNEGLDEALTNIYDLIILDVMLPGTDGFEILKELRLENIDSKILMLTARSLSYNPEIILADEPTGNLDKETENDVLEIFKKLAHEENKCVIIVTHSPNVCDKVDEVFELKKQKN